MLETPQTPAFHPLANLFPLMPDGELKRLVQDMETHGFDPLFPIVLYNGQILDGRNRFRAARIAKVEPVFQELNDLEDPEQFVIRANEHRRHLEMEWLRKAREERMARVARARQEGKSTREIARMEGVSQTQVMNDWEEAQNTINRIATGEHGCSPDALAGTLPEDPGKIGGEPSKTPVSEEKRPENPATGEGPERIVGSDGKTYPARKPGPLDPGKSRKSRRRDAGTGEPQQLLDPLGFIVPESLRAVFEEKHVGSILSELRSIQISIIHLGNAPAGAFLKKKLRPDGEPGQDRTIAWKMDAMEAVIVEIEGAVPHACHCPECHAQSRGQIRPDCPACEGHGWVTKPTWEQSRPDWREAVERDCPRARPGSRI